MRDALGGVGVVPASNGPQLNDRISAVLDSRQSGFENRPPESWLSKRSRIGGRARTATAVRAAPAAPRISSMPMTHCN